MKLVEYYFDILSKKIEQPKDEPKKESPNSLFNLFSYFSSRLLSSSTSSVSTSNNLEFNKKIFKCIMTGDHHVGKTSFVKSSLDSLSIGDYTPGVVSSAHTFKIYKLWDGILRDLQLWDQPAYFYTSLYKRNANTALIMFDLNRLESLDRAENDINDIKGTEKVESILIGNKTDLVPDYERIIQRKRAQLIAFKSNGSLYLEINCVDVKHAHNILLFVAVMMYLRNGDGSNEKGIKDF
ncbi:predicted protein [Naegleria gruberi]|uniref:Predicted protein n=1 Tax=Naegleria gruberi TaxID=5762 RepID=D2VDW1_NAEGR|nr:uncharacterized protein NAEGRDRAFT_67061 [Naegleria gruberi]EFC45066.1 predicted protein [Naegleria gruberi]|eukprot:XP_002677810.1 predicted protein [Naegleria gruberi strain NEG-M]